MKTINLGHTQQSDLIICFCGNIAILIQFSMAYILVIIQYLLMWVQLKLCIADAANDGDDARRTWIHRHRDIFRNSWGRLEGEGDYWEPGF